MGPFVANWVFLKKLFFIQYIQIFRFVFCGNLVKNHPVGKGFKCFKALESVDIGSCDRRARLLHLFGLEGVSQATVKGSQLDLIEILDQHAVNKVLFGV